MAYQKKNNYPSLKIKGIYNRTGSRQELGLDNSNLEELSLGNWNTIVKDNKILPVTTEEDLLMPTDHVEIFAFKSGDKIAFIGHGAGSGEINISAVD
jgi:hypothetical protein